jgi:chemotaxis-related protein WspD
MSHQAAIAVNECWKTIGRPGPGTCPELVQHVQCTNCPTYAEAALRLLDRPTPPDYVREWTEHLAGERKRTVAATVPALVFRLGSEWLALPASMVEQVTEPSTVHTLPHRRLPVRGVVSVRGELIVCVSLESLLGLDGSPAAAPAQAYQRLVVLSFDGARLAFHPHEVHGVRRYDPAALIAAPATLARRAGSRFTAGMFEWESRTVGLLDAGEVMTSLTRSLS